MGLHDETVTVLRRTAGPPDRSGVVTWTTDRLDIEGCHIEQISSDEAIANETGPSTTKWRVSTSAVTEWILKRDLVEYRGEELHVHGRPAHYRGYKPHTEFVLTETED